MQKEEILRELSQMLESGEIRRQEIVDVLGGQGLYSKEGITLPKKKHRHFSLTKILYGIGALIVIIGIGFFIAQVWNDLGSVGRIAITFGLGVLIAISGSVLLNAKPDSSIGKVFHVIGGLIIPGGVIVLLQEMSMANISVWLLALAFGILFVFYLALTFIHKKEILTFFAIANGTATIYFVVVAMLDAMLNSSYTFVYDLYVYLTMAVGLVYLLLAYGFRHDWNKKLVPLLYFFGSIAFLGAAFTRVFVSGLWEIIFFVLALGGVALSVYLRSKAVLVVSTLALAGYIVYITGEYFADSLGWPISLIILGFVIIGLGYGSVSISKRFIALKK